MAKKSPTDVCGLCGNTRQWHDENKPVHQFDGDAGELTAGSDLGAEQQASPPSTPQVRTQRAGVDPVLRAILISKGLVTADELHAAEEEVRRNGILIVRERVAMSDGDPGDSGPDHGDRDGEVPSRSMWGNLSDGGSGGTHQRLS